MLRSACSSDASWVAAQAPACSPTAQGNDEIAVAEHIRKQAAAEALRAKAEAGSNLRVPVVCRDAMAAGSAACSRGRVSIFESVAFVRGARLRHGGPRIKIGLSPRWNG